jgi:hypothetical protein
LKECEQTVTLFLYFFAFRPCFIKLLLEFATMSAQPFVCSGNPCELESDLINLLLVNAACRLQTPRRSGATIGTGSAQLILEATDGGKVLSLTLLELAD